MWLLSSKWGFHLHIVYLDTEAYIVGLKECKVALYARKMVRSDGR